jgi:outer membrane protein OmpA-like peptidoglycan-associated protein
MSYRPFISRLGSGFMALFFICCMITFVSCGGDAPASDPEVAHGEHEGDDMDHDHDGSDADGHDHDDMDGMEAKTTGELAAGSAEAKIQDFITHGTGTMVVVLDKIPFEGEELSDEGNAQLDALADMLKNNPNLHIEIQGHTTQAKNAVGATTKKTLSGARALWVKTKLSLRGAAASQMDANGYGDEMLLPEIAPDDEAQKRIAIAMSK